MEVARPHACATTRPIFAMHEEAERAGDARCANIPTSSAPMIVSTIETIGLLLLLLRNTSTRLSLSEVGRPTVLVETENSFGVIEMKKLIATTAVLILTVGSASAGKPNGGSNNKPLSKPGGISVQQTPVTGVSGTRPGGFPKPITNVPASQPLTKQQMSKSPVQGFPQGGKLPPNHVNSNKKPCYDYHFKCGKVFGSGYCYEGKNHCHWTYNCYWPKYQCQTYWCPSTTCYYYWCEPKCCYYPISYIASAPPVQAAPVVQNGPPAGIPMLPE